MIMAVFLSCSEWMDLNSTADHRVCRTVICSFMITCQQIVDLKLKITQIFSDGVCMYVCACVSV